MPTPPRLFLIDGSSQMYRAYHAIRGLTGPDGKSTNAVYGFVTMLRKLINDHQPQYIAASFDLRRTDLPRSELVTDYKANRAPMPGDLAEQIPWVHEACEAMGVPILTSKRYEADDVIGTLATKATAAGFEVGDRHRRQGLLSAGPRRHQGLQPEGRRNLVRRRTACREKFGVTPEQVVDVLALMGDSIDNIKGVPGIGEKGARDLIATYGTLESLLAHAAEVLEQAVPRRPARQRRGRAAEPRAGADSHRRAGRFRARGDALPRQLAASAASSCSRAWASGRWSWSSRRPRRQSARTTRRRHAGGSASAGRRASRGGPVRRSACCRSAPSAMLRIDRRPVVLDRGRARRTTCRSPAAASGFDGAFGRRSGAATMPRARLLEDEGIRKVGHDLKFDAHDARAPRRRPARARDRHDARQLSDRRHSIRASRSKIWRSSTRATRR